MRKCPGCGRRLFDRGRCYACGYEGLLPVRSYVTIQGYRIKIKSIASWIYEKPIPNFDRLLK